MARPAKLDWELYKDQLLQLKKDGKSLTEINKILYEKIGVGFSNARISQKFTQWARDPEAEAAARKKFETILEGISNT